MKPVSIGQPGRLELETSPADSAARYGNLGVEVLATPVLCHWFESASVVAIREQLDPGEATVGTRLTIEHLKATPIGMRVTVDAEVESVDGRQIGFRIEAHDETELIARGTHERYVVALDRFLAGVRAKAGTRAE